MSDLDELMFKNPLKMTAEDIDTIIAYHRKRRATLAAGGKAPRAKKETGPAKTIDLKALGLKKSEPGSIIKRRPV